MATTYSPYLESLKDQVRFLVGDRAAPWQFQDEEITGMIALRGNNAQVVAVELIDSLIAKYAGRSGTTSVGPFTVSYSELIDQYRMIRDRLENLINASASVFGPFLSGHRPTSDTHGSKPFLFNVGQDDYQTNLDRVGEHVPWWGQW